MHFLTRQRMPILVREVIIVVCVYVLGRSAAVTHTSRPSLRLPWPPVSMMPFHP
jgi:hypothetical protein